jgi:hypothetical protein
MAEREPADLPDVMDEDYPGPRTTSSGERVSPDTAEPPRPAKARAKDGAPAAASGGDHVEPADKASSASTDALPLPADSKGSPSHHRPTPVAPHDRSR